MFNEQAALAQVKDFFVNTWEKFSGFFNSYSWEEILFNVKIGFILISFLLLLLIIFLLLKISLIIPLNRALTEYSKPRDPTISKKKVAKKWNKIEIKLRSGVQGNYKMALIEASKLFNTVLKNVGYGIGKKLESIDEIKESEKVKDKIVEDKKFKLSKEEAESSVDAYKKGLEELDVL